MTDQAVVVGPARTIHDRPLKRVWRGVLTRGECLALHRRAASEGWYAEAAFNAGIIGSGHLPVTRRRAFRPFAALGEAFEGVACQEAQMHSDENAPTRYHAMGLLSCAASRARIMEVLDGGIVETSIVGVGDAFVLDLHRAHAAHSTDLEGPRRMMVFWSVPLAGIQDMGDAERAADGLVRMIADARRGND